MVTSNQAATSAPLVRWRPTLRPSVRATTTTSNATNATTNVPRIDNRVIAR
jgi:hypothetical protein